MNNDWKDAQNLAKFVEACYLNLDNIPNETVMQRKERTLEFALNVVRSARKSEPKQ